MKKIIQKNKKAFTILELLVVVAVIAILAVIATPLYLNKIDSAKQSALLADETNVNTAMSMYAIDNIVDYSSYASLSNFTSLTNLVATGYLSAVPNNPWAGTSDPKAGWTYQVVVDNSQ